MQRLLIWLFGDKPGTCYPEIFIKNSSGVRVKKIVNPDYSLSDRRTPENACKSDDEARERINAYYEALKEIGIEE